MKTKTDALTLQRLLDRGVCDIIVREDLEKKLKSGKPLRVKLGIDPTGPRLHIGRGVPLRKLSQFQEAGHQIVLIIGDFTGLVGDASDKDSERPMLTREVVEKNMKEYLPQIGRILDIDKCEIHYNSTWLAPMGFFEIAQLSTHFSVAEMLDRDNFSKRFKAGKRISLQEFLYPLMQGYDSVAIKADLEVGGSDQLFNVLAGRPLQKSFGQEPQNIMTFPLIEGTDGRKMSTSWGNTIYLDEDPKEIFGKIMSIPDILMEKYFECLTDLDLDEAKSLIKHDPRNAKVKLATLIVEWLHDKASAQEALEDFETKFVKKEVPEDIPEQNISESISLVSLLVEKLRMFKTTSEVRRLIEQGGVTLDGQKIDSPSFVIDTAPTDRILRAGKRLWIRLKAA